jgi:hypothetical protein
VKHRGERAEHDLASIGAGDGAQLERGGLVAVERDLEVVRLPDHEAIADDERRHARDRAVDRHRGSGRQ